MLSTCIEMIRKYCVPHTHPPTQSLTWEFECTQQTGIGREYHKQGHTGERKRNEFRRKKGKIKCAVVGLTKPIVASGNVHFPFYEIVCLHSSSPPPSFMSFHADSRWMWKAHTTQPTRCFNHKLKCGRTHVVHEHTFHVSTSPSHHVIPSVATNIENYLMYWNAINNSFSKWFGIDLLRQKCCVWMPWYRRLCEATMLPSEDRYLNATHSLVASECLGEGWRRRNECECKSCTYLWAKKINFSKVWSINIEFFFVCLNCNGIE